MFLFIKKYFITITMSILERFIVFEGLDGAGTTTQSRLLSQYLEQNNRRTYLTCEPTDSPIGKLIREILSGKKHATPRALALLYAADRDNHLYGEDSGVTSILQRYDYAISDRYFFSSVAYQSVDTPLSQVLSFNQYFPYPEYIIYIDTPVSACMERITKRDRTRDIFEHEEFQTAVRRNYERSFNNLPEGVHFFRIDGTRSIDAIHQEICERLNHLMNIASP